MAEATVSILMTAEESKLHQAVMSAAAAFAQLDTGVAKVAKSSREAEKAEAELGRAAKRVYDETRTPQEQYNARMDKLNALVKAGKTDQETFARAAKQAGDALKASGDNGIEAYGPKALGMVKEFAGALGIGFGIAGAVALIKKEWDNVAEVQDRVLKATLPVADAQRKFRGAAGFASLEEAATFDEKIKTASTATGVTSKELYLNAADAMKDRGMLSKEQAMQAVEVGAKLFPADPEGRQKFIEASMGMQEATGWSGERASGTLLAGAQRAGMNVPSMAPLLNALPGEDPLKVMALAQGLGESTKMDPTKAVIGIFKGLEGLASSKEESEVAEKNIAGEMLKAKEAAKSAAKQDPVYLLRMKELDTQNARLSVKQHAKLSDDARVQLNANNAAKRRALAEEERQALKQAEERAEAAPEYLNKVAELEGQKNALKDKKSIGNTFDERLAYARARPELVGQIVEGMGFKGKFPKLKLAAMQLLTGTGAATEHVDRAFASQITEGEAGGVLAQQQKVMGGGSSQIIAGMGRDLKVVQDKLLTSTALSDDAATAQAKIDLVPLLTSAGELSIAADFANVRGRLSGDYLDSMQGTLERAAKQRLNPVTNTNLYGGGDIESLPTPRAPTEKETAQGTALLEAVKILKQVSEDLKAANKAANATKPTLGRPDSRN